MTSDARPAWLFTGGSLPPALLALLAGLAFFAGGGTSRQGAGAPAVGDDRPGAAVARPGDARADEDTPAPVDGTWLDATNAASETMRLIAEYLGDTGCDEAARAMAVPTARQPTPALAATGEPVACTVLPIVAALADYDDSNSRWHADRTLATLQNAVAAGGFTLERYHLPGAREAAQAATQRNGRHAAPDAERAPSRREPGVLVFRHLAGTASTLPALRRVRGVSPAPAAASEPRAGVQVLVLLMVPEMPTSGIERLPFLLAARLALALQATRGDDPSRDVLQILGPAYSGSTLSLLRAIEEVAAIEATGIADRAARRLDVRVTSGSATSETNAPLLDGPLPGRGRITFRRTVHDDDTLLRALQRQLGAIRPEWACGKGVALLTESNTGWGVALTQQNAPHAADASGGHDVEEPGCPPEALLGTRAMLRTHALKLGFPRNIANRYASRQRTLPAAPQYAPFLPPVEVLRLDDTITPTDVLPTFTPFITDASRDRALSSALSQLQRRQIGAVGILATDVRDHLFLAREINRVAPDVVMFGTEPDILMLHPEYQPYVRGTLMASSYPLQSHVQALTHGPDGQDNRVQFTSMSQQGLHNAVLLVLGDDLPAHAAPTASVAATHPFAHLLVDYREPHRHRGDDHHAGEDHGPAPPQVRDQCAAEGAASPQTAGARITTGGRPAPWVVAAGQHEFVPLAAYPELLSREDCALVPAAVADASASRHTDFLFASTQQRVLWLIPVLATSVLLGVLAIGHVRLLPAARWLSPPALLERVERGHVARTVRGFTRRGSEREAHVTEHAMLTLGTALALGGFLTWLLYLWAGAAEERRLEQLPVLAGAVTLLGAVRIVWLGLRHFLVVVAARVGGRRDWHARLVRAVESGAPEAVALGVLATGVLFMIWMWQYVWPVRDPQQVGIALFSSARALDLSNLLSVGPVLALFPLMTCAWTLWSLRTLYYQRISPTRAMPLVHGLVSHDAEDRRLEHALAATLGTTMQPAGAFLLLPAVFLALAILFLEPRTASIEGELFSRLLVTGTILAGLAITLELGQAAWLANRVLRLLERVRIHPLSADIEAMQALPFDWRPALQPPAAAHRLLVRTLERTGRHAPSDALLITRHDRVPVLRTRAWQLALIASGRCLLRNRQRPERTLDEPHRALIALVVSLLLQALVTRVVRGFGISFLLAAMLMLAHLLTAFSGRSFALLMDLGVLVITAVLAVRALLALERDHVLSKLWHGTPGQLNLNSGLVWRAIAYVGVPLLTILAARFPEVGGQMVTILEPLRHLLPTP